MKNNSLFNQYEKLKAKYPDVIILIRIADFYHTFCKDAEIVSSVLKLELVNHTTERNTYGATGFHASRLDEYLKKIVKSGNKVGLCDQLHDPKHYPKDLYGRTIYPDAFNSYSPGHPWYYHLRGPIIMPEHIQPENLENFLDVDVPKDLLKLERLQSKHREDLNKDIKRYLEVAESLDPDDINSCTSMSLKYNHIIYHRSYLKILSLKAGEQTTLFA